MIGYVKWSIYFVDAKVSLSDRIVLRATLEIIHETIKHFLPCLVELIIYVLRVKDLEHLSASQIST